MISARMLAFAIVLGVSSSSAQTAQQCTLGVHVGDPAGAPIPNARVHVTSISPDEWTDQDGLAFVSLRAGKYTVSVAASSFARWSGTIEVEPRNCQQLEVRLRVASYSGPTVVVDDRPFEIQRFLPEAVFPLVPLDRLALPQRKLRFARSHHSKT